MPTDDRADDAAAGNRGVDRAAGDPAEPGGALVPVRVETEPLPQSRYRELFARIDARQADLEHARARLDAARAESRAAESTWAEVEGRAHELWWQWRRRLGRRGRGLEGLPQPDPDAPSGINLDGLLNEITAEVAGDPVPPARRVPHWLIMPGSAAVFGGLGFLFTRLWLHVAGVNVVGALGVVGLGLGPLAGVVVGLRWRAHHSGGPVETEPAPALLGFVVAAAVEVALHYALG